MIRQREPIKRTVVKKRRTGKPRRGPGGIPADQWRNRGYLDFLKVHGRCTVCRQEFMIGNIGPFRHIAPKGFCDPCHGPVNGMSSKGPDAEAIPMCRAHHEEQTRMGWFTFEALYNFDRASEARAWWVAYQIWKEQA